MRKNVNIKVGDVDYDLWMAQSKIVLFFKKTLFQS